MTFSTVRGETRVNMSYEEIQKMIRLLLAVIEVDEQFYIDNNPDVADGIRSGTIRSAREHFMDHGYFEGRQPYAVKVDERWYLEHNEDVAATVRVGTYASGQAHFDGPGYPEGRRPYPDVV